jgi:hypothetical protein
MVACAALGVPPTSNVYTPQDLAHRVVGLDYGNGTAYAGLQMLQGAARRDHHVRAERQCRGSLRRGAAG